VHEQPSAPRQGERASIEETRRIASLAGNARHPLKKGKWK
jgi:hypothetical protein